MNEKKTEGQEETSHKTHAYERMLERLREPLEHWEKPHPSSFHERLERVKEHAVHLGELTRNEAEEVAAYVRRDLHDAAEYVRKSRSKIADWLRLDLIYLEDRIADLLSRTVDEARAELKRWTGEGELTPEWHTGEVTAPGTLFCTSCGQEIHLHKTAHIPPCPKCHGTVFQRPAHPREE